MPTHELAGDAKRLSLQVIDKQKDIIGQAYFSKGYKSLSEYVRKLMELGMEVEDPELARKYKAVSLNRYSKSVGLCIIGGIAVFQSLTGNFELRRSSTLTSVVRVKEVRA